MNTLARALVLSACSLVPGPVICASAAKAVDATITVDPTTTYLLTNLDPQALDSPAIDLAALGLRAGDHILLQSVGDFCFTIFNPLGCANTETAHPMIGIFSSSSTLLPSSILNRVPGAIEAGPSVTTFPTLFGTIPTDVPQDFIIFHAPFSTVVTIPDNAQFLFVAVLDSFYGDNADPDGDLAVVIARVPAKIAFGFESNDVSGFPTGAARITGGGSFDLGTGFVHAAGGFRCTASVLQGPLNGCQAGEGIRWDTADVLISTGFKCSGSSGESAKTAITGANTVVLLADFYRQGDGNDESFTARMIVSDLDLAPDISGVQNVWIQGIGCGFAIVHFNATVAH